jgi:hypothetical protein
MGKGETRRIRHSGPYPFTLPLFPDLSDALQPLFLEAFKSCIIKLKA